MSSGQRQMKHWSSSLHSTNLAYRAACALICLRVINVHSLTASNSWAAGGNLQSPAQMCRHPAKFGFIAAGEKAGFLPGSRMDLQFDHRAVVHLHAAGVGADSGDLSPRPVTFFHAEKSGDLDVQPAGVGG